MKAEKLLIGWASRDITPAKPAILQGQFHVRVSTSVHDPLVATAWALESQDRSQQCIMISLDTVGVTERLRDECRKVLREQLPDFDAARLVLHATHTHTAPAQPGHLYPPQAPEVTTDQEVLDLMVGGITGAAVDAWRSRKPGAVSWGRGQAVVGYNRRMTEFDGVSKMYGKTDTETFSHIEGYEDHAVDLLFTYDEECVLTGMIVNLACPSQVTENADFLSADFWHETREAIRAWAGEELYILPQCSAAGDQSPHLLLNKKAEERMLRLKGFGDDFNMAQRKSIAFRIAEAVADVLPVASKDIRFEVPFTHEAAVIDLPMRKVTEDEVDYCRSQVEVHDMALALCKDKDPSSHECSRNYMRSRYFGRVIERFRTQGVKPVLPMESHVIRLGDVAFATNRFELFLDFGIRIKARSRALQTFVVQLAGAGTYLPTAKAVNARSYGAGIESNLVGPDGGQVLVNEQLKVIERLFEE